MSGTSRYPSSIRYLQTRDDAFYSDDFLTDARHAKEGQEAHEQLWLAVASGFPFWSQPRGDIEFAMEKQSARTLDRASNASWKSVIRSFQMPDGIMARHNNIHVCGARQYTLDRLHELWLVRGIVGHTSICGTELRRHVPDT
ncbi:hypothetical protein LIA77_09346 [Sarocladium implicatum]|nr:hypothetical protein LIA77_09346 [Sarocladium implicatum]